MTAEKNKIFVLDTNVLIHDPTALFRFAEHDIYIPLVVLEELDAAKKGVSEVARNARQASRFFDELIQNVQHEEVSQGIPLNYSPFYISDDARIGKIFFQQQAFSNQINQVLPDTKVDNTLLNITLGLQQSHSDNQVILISKDINLRIKAKILKIKSEDYQNDRVLDDVEQLYTGWYLLPNDFWETHNKELDSWQEEGRTFYKIQGPLIQYWHTNQCLSSPENQLEAIVRSIKGDHAIIELLNDHRNDSQAIWGIKARNPEQNFALNLLMDPEIDFITLQGPAGTGKTLLALAAALEQTIEKKLYSEIIITRVTVPVGEDIGFLPGTEEEKMTPWMGALTDNLEVLAPSNNHQEREAKHELLRRWIKVHSLNFMRGRTFLNKIVIIDEAQNLTPKQMKTLVTRAGPGTKVICMGNVAQIDTPYITETSSGLTYVVDRFKQWNHSGHMTLQRGERSRLADYASEQL